MARTEAIQIRVNAEDRNDFEYVAGRMRMAVSTAVREVMRQAAADLRKAEQGAVADPEDGP
jgi:antitoxin component of RelBE/YafQ-DinJ toxin-antitoxin module